MTDLFYCEAETLGHDVPYWKYIEAHSCMEALMAFMKELDNFEGRGNYSVTKVEKVRFTKD